MKTKTKNTGIRAKVKFYLWLVSIGADLKNFEPENIQIHEIPAKRKSSFKNRGPEIKAKFNHRFKLDRTSDDLLLSHPNIELITFERKTA